MSDPAGKSEHESEFDAELVGLPIGAHTDRDVSRDPVELAASAFAEELRKGQYPNVEAFARRYPEHADRIRQMLPLVAAMESWKTNRELSGAKQSSAPTMKFERLGDCRIVKEIGRGGMGVVYEAVQEPSGRRVAVKVLPWRFEETSPWRQRFEREARTTESLDHDHIVRCYGWGQTEGWCYYVMHLVEGVSLDRIIRLLREPAGTVFADELHDSATAVSAARVLRRDSWGQIAKIGLQAASALRYAHEKGILHRDIKPANLLLDRHGTVWLADFGMASQTDALQKPGARHFGGTLTYLAPEQLEGRVDERSDIYSLGVTLYELCTLRAAFAATDRTKLLEQVQSAQPARPRSVNPQVPVELERIILKATSKLPERRYQTADEFSNALRLFAKGKASPVSGWREYLRRFFLR